MMQSSLPQRAVESPHVHELATHSTSDVSEVVVCDQLLQSKRRRNGHSHSVVSCMVVADAWHRPDPYRRSPASVGAVAG